MAFKFFADIRTVVSQHKACMLPQAFANRCANHLRKLTIFLFVTVVASLQECKWAQASCQQGAHKVSYCFIVLQFSHHCGWRCFFVHCLVTCLIVLSEKFSWEVCILKQNFIFMKISLPTVSPLPTESKWRNLPYPPIYLDAHPNY